MVFYYNDAPDIKLQPSNQLQIEYRGFAIRKAPGYDHYGIVPPQGKQTCQQLEGDFTGRRIIENHIDTFLKEHTVEEAFVVPETPKPKRGRPPMGNQQEELKEETQQT
jgi:hypothetical protein